MTWSFKHSINNPVIRTTGRIKGRKIKILTRITLNSKIVLMITNYLTKSTEKLLIKIRSAGSIGRSLVTNTHHLNILI